MYRITYSEHQKQVKQLNFDSANFHQNNVLCRAQTEKFTPPPEVPHRHAKMNKKYFLRHGAKHSPSLSSWGRPSASFRLLTLKRFSFQKTSLWDTSGPIFRTQAASFVNISSLEKFSIITNTYPNPRRLIDGLRLGIKFQRSCAERWFTAWSALVTFSKSSRYAFYKSWLVVSLRYL